MKSEKRTLGDCVDILSGFAFKSGEFNVTGHGLPLIRIRDVVTGSSGTYFSGDYSDTYLIEDGDLLVGMDGDFNREIWFGGLALLNQRVCKITAHPGILDQRYLYHFLPQELDKIHARTSAVTVKHLSVKGIRAIEIDLPHLEEQKRIAAILDKADNLRRKRQQAIQLADEFLRSVFLDMFDDVEGKAASVSNVDLLADSEKGSIRTGPFGSQLLHSEFTHSGVAVLGIDNVVDNEFKWGKLRFITKEKYKQLERYTVKPGDVLITIMGTCGRCTVVPDDIPLAINTKHLCCITLDGKKCLPSFLHAFFLYHPMSHQYLSRTTKGAIMDGLNMGIIKEMPVPLFPIESQVRYREISNNVAKSIERLVTSENALKNLFSSLSQKTFRGEI